MLDTEVCRDLSARCGGTAAIGVGGEGAAELLSRLNAEGAEGLIFKEDERDCAALIFIDDGAERDYSAVAGGRPFIVLTENGAETEKRYGRACLSVNPYDADESAMNSVMRALLAEFPVRIINVNIPEWMQVMPCENSAIAELLEKVRAASEKITCMKHMSSLDSLAEDAKYWSPAVTLSADYSCGAITVAASAKDGIFFEMLSEIAGDEITGEYSLMRYVRSATEAKRGYAKVRDALECARINGYGIVQPAGEDLSYEQPQIVRQGSSVGIKLRASAPSYHIIRVDVTGEVSPIMGEAGQSENIVRGMMNGFENNPEETWNTDVFGKSLRSMVQDGLSSKVSCIQEETRGKLRKAITRMVNEGKGGVICIIL